MNHGDLRLDTLTSPQRSAVRALLIGATAAAGRSADREHLERLVESAPVGALPAAAALHRVAGSVIDGLEGVDGVPRDVRNELAAIQQWSALRHLLFTGVLGEIGTAFDDHGLSWAVMKGPAVAALFYPDVGDRTYGDLDLLVDRRGFENAIGILEDLGYRHSVHDWAFAEDQLVGQVTMSTPAASIDVHWHLHYSRQDRQPFALEPGAMIQRARRVPISGLSAPTLDPVDTLLTLSFHAARSDGHRLMWLKDIERAIVVDEPDFDELVRRSRKYRCAPPVGLILGRARWLLGAPVPDSVIQALTPASLRVVDPAVTRVSHPVQLHDRGTMCRLVTRSVRSSAVASVRAVPRRGVRSWRRRFSSPPPNDTDDPLEKASYLRAVANSTEP